MNLKRSALGIDRVAVLISGWQQINSAAASSWSRMNSTANSLSLINARIVTEPGVTPSSRCIRSGDAKPNRSLPRRVLSVFKSTVFVSGMDTRKWRLPLLFLRNRFLVFAPSIFGEYFFSSSQVKSGGCSIR